MYTIRILIGDSKPFEIVTTFEGLYTTLVLIDTNSLTFFKVFSGGEKRKQSEFGWKGFRGWVEKFKYEE